MEKTEKISQEEKMARTLYAISVLEKAGYAEKIGDNCAVTQKAITKSEELLKEHNGNSVMVCTIMVVDGIVANIKEKRMSIGMISYLANMLHFLLFNKTIPQD